MHSIGIYKKGNLWWMIKQYKGKRVERSLDTRLKRVAEERYHKIAAQIVDGKYFDAQYEDTPFSEMAERYLREYSARKDYYQKARDHSIVKRLYQYFGSDATLADVGSLVGGYEQYRRGQGVRPATILKELGLLRRMFNIARRQWRWKVSNPVSEIELPRVRNERVRYLSDDERQRLITALTQMPERWLMPVVIIGLDTGLRLGNLCGLRWHEVNLSARMIIISAVKMKNRDYLGIPLTERAYLTLKELDKEGAVSELVFHDKGEPLYDRKVQRAFKRALKKAGIEDFHFHDLRHTFASYLCQRGVDLHTIAKLMGHRDLRMTNRYSHLSVESLKNAVMRLQDGSTTILRQTGEGVRNDGA